MTAGRLQQRRGGPLWIWEMPDPDKSYALGVDTSAGVRGGDPCVVEVIDMASCAQVAEWYGFAKPHEFGPIVAMLGWRYNDALAGIETHPSPHGLSVFDAAEAFGYTNLFVQKQWDSREARAVTKKGWITSEQSKLALMNLFAASLSDGIQIRSERLLQECLDAQYDDRDRIDRGCKNDCIVAFSIALKIRELAYREGRVAPPPEPRLDFEGSYWREYERQRADGDPSRPRPRSLTSQLYEGI